MDTVFVVIPYFQREPGILRNALQSVLAQRYTDWHVIVSDDESPVPAESELRALEGFPDSKLTVVTGPNGGPAVARNRALDALPPQARHVAFLDSDDTWSDDHLHNAMNALGQGYDFYFADLLQLGGETTAFERAGRITPSKHPELEGDGLRAYAGDLFNQTLTGNVIGTSTVVYRFDKYSDTRFQNSFTFAGEDYLFWMQLQKKGATAAFSEHCEAFYGKGVNVFAGSGWGTANSLARIVDEIRFNKSLSDFFELSNEQKTLVDLRLSGLRRSFAMDIAHRVRHGKSIKPELIRKLVSTDPKSIVLLIPNALLGLYDRRTAK